MEEDKKNLSERKPFGKAFRRTLLSFTKRSVADSLAATLLAILAGLLLGVLVMIVAGILDPVADAETTADGIGLLLFGIFSTGRDWLGNLTFGFNGVHIGNMLFKSMPLLMTGLSVALAMKAGLFNIGAPGQYLIGTMMTLILALSIPSSSVPPALIWLLALLGGMTAAGLWGAVPGALKAYLNINEVLGCILTNWIAANLVTLVFEESSLRNLTEASKSGLIYKTSVNGVATPKLFLEKLFPGSQVNAGILIAVLFAIGVRILMKRTTFGYELRVCGSNREAARYAGMKDKRNIVLAMALAGALAGGGAALYYLSGNTEFSWSTYQSLPAVGFNGIPAALLAVCNPLGIIFSSLFLSALEVNGQQIANLTTYNEYIASFISALIIYLSAFSLYVRKLLKNRRKKG